MNAGHLTRRPLRGRDRFGWLRMVDEPCTTVTYRLFLRDEVLTAHMEAWSFPADTSRLDIAKRLRGMRAQLRWRVDKLDFERIGLEDTTPQPEAMA